MTQHTINEAAALVSRDRKSIYRAIKEGRLSATTSATGQKQVDTAELLRVYGPFTEQRGKRPGRATVATPQRETPEATARMALLEAELRHARELLESKDAQIADLRRVVLLLEHKSAQEPRKKRNFWPW